MTKRPPTSPADSQPRRAGPAAARRRRRHVDASLPALLALHSLPPDERMRRVLAFGCAQLGVPVGILARFDAERCQVVEAVGA